MPLITSTTNLNKLKFGIGNAGDRFDNGSSNQPYIRKDIPGVDVDNPNPTPITQLDSSGQPIYGDLEPSSLDILFRGGLNAPRDAATDVSRLSKMLFDDKSPNGLIFTANQNLLSRTSVMTEASYGVAYGSTTKPDFITGTGGGAVPGGIYLPSSTLAQAGVGFSGTHLNLMGLDPTSPNGITGQTSGISNLLGFNGPGAGLRTYTSAAALNNQMTVGQLNAKPFITENRLIRIYDKKQRRDNSDADVILYKGGPGSVLGIGDTRIRFAQENYGGALRTGRNNSLATTDPFYFNGNVSTYAEQYKQTTVPSGQLAYSINDLSDKQGLSSVYKIPGGNESLVTNQSNVYNMNMYSATYTLGTSFPNANGDDARSVYSISNPNNLSNSALWNAIQLAGGKDSSGIGKIRQDFRKKVLSTLGPGGVPLEDNKKALGVPQRNILSLSPSYLNKNREKRVNSGDPGSNGAKTQKGISGRLNYGVKANEMLALDKINAQTMYVSSGPNGELAINDYCKFRIAAIDNAPDAAGNAVYMHFRAFIDSFSDSYNSSWNPTQFSGRGDKLYNYGGFERTINLAFTVYAQSKAELIPMYKKLNYLASTMTPDYNTAGFMRGNLVRLTLGGYLYEQPGFISSFTYEAPQEASWEIAINEKGTSDSSVKELPFMIKVTGMSFTPIQDFLPRKIKPEAANGMDGDQMIEERYISLANKIGDSLYRDEYLSQKPTDDTDTTDSELNQQEGSDEEKAVGSSNNDVETDQAAVNNGSNDVNIQNVTSGTTLGEGQETTITPSSDSNSNPSGGVLTARQRWLQGDSPGAVDTRRRIAEGNARIAEKKRLAAIEELKEQ
jgi:hypothetical protein